MKINYMGRSYELVQDAYIIKHDSIDKEMYMAHVIDEFDNDFIMMWNTSEYWNSLEPEDREDESIACDWDNPVSVIEI